MGFKFGTTSMARLDTCDRALQAVMRRAIATSPVDFAITCGERNEADQNEAFANGKSNARFGQSAHNLSPSAAIDVAPYINGKIAWDDDDAWEGLTTHILSVALDLGIPLTWGGLFVSIKDQPHFELKFWKELK